FGPAVMAACGRGFENPAAHSIAALDAFLDERSGHFSCSDLGLRPVVVPFDNFQAVTRNLLIAAALVWRVAGVSWQALDSVAAMMFGVTLAAAYMVMQFAMGRWPAIVGTALWGLSPMHLANVPHLRDYSKAPFFVLTALTMGLAVLAQRPRMLVLIGAAFGVVQAVGFGMRTDVILNFAPFVLVLLVLGSGELKKNVSAKLIGISASVVLFVALSWPVLTVYRRSEGLWHVSLLGLTTPFNDALNLRPAPYDFGYLYDDSYISTFVQAYWYRVHSSAQVSLHDVGLYSAACREYYSLLLSTFPADFMTRMAGSLLRVLNLPFSISYGIVPVGVTNAFITWLAHARASIMLALSGVGPMAAFALLVLIGTRNRVAAILGFVILLFWGAYPYLQLQGRHVFHLEIVTIAALLWTAQMLWRTLRETMTNNSWRQVGRRALQSFATVTGLILVGILGLGLLRNVQVPRVRALFDHYVDAPQERVDVQEAVEPDRLVRLRTAMFEPPGPAARIQQAMLVMDVMSSCGSDDIPVHVRYERAGTTELNFSRDFTVSASSRAESTRVFVPVYSIEMANGSVSRFVSVDVPAAAKKCVRLSRARELEQIPLMLDASLPYDWRSRPLYQRLYIAPIMPERVWLRVARWLPRVAEIG
ncbi:MAG TPA: hypothetical protein VLV86_04590, partial [Vicinamibacterales bacterium]|nr:hypothetical protein [Vicinamibacterales bacterium]